jgi:MFS family permease
MASLEVPQSTPEEQSRTPSLSENGSSNPDLVSSAEKAAPTDPSQDPNTVRPIHGWKWIVAMLALYSTAFLYGLDTTIAADIQPDIVKAFGQIQKLGWIGTGFPLGSVATILPIGYAYGLFNIKHFYILSVILFEIGSAVCGAAPTMDALIIGRVIAGVGGAGMYLGVLNYISVFTTIRERSMYAALCGLVWGLGTVIGPLIGGGFAISSASWRWAFYINLPLAAAAAPAIFLWLPAFQPRKEIGFIEKLKHLDWLGIVLIAAVYSTYVLAITFGGAQWHWSDYRFITMITFFGAILLTFILTQYFTILTTKERRIFPGQFLKHRSLLLLYFGTSAAATTLFVGVYFIPLYFQFARDDSAIMAAVRLLPFIIIMVTFVMLNGALMPVFGYYMPWYLASGILMLIGGSLMYTVDEHTPVAAVYGYSILMAAGAGLSAQTAYSVAPAKLPPDQVPAAVGFINLAQIGSIVISLTIAGSVFQNIAFTNLLAALAPFEVPIEEIRSALAGTQSAVFASGNAEVRAAAIKAIVQAMDKVYALVIAAGAVSIVSSLGMKREKLFLKVVAGG